jgi:hypothetical protein
MTDLFLEYSIPQLIVFTIGIIIFIKGGWDIIDFFREKYKKKFNKDYDTKRQEEVWQEHYLDCQRQYEETMGAYESLSEKMDGVINSVEKIGARVNELIESDKHDIKQDIVRNYHFFVDKQGWIDDFSLDTLELRFEDYKSEGGNSYIAGLMSEIRQLPKHPPMD